MKKEYRQCAAIIDDLRTQNKKKRETMLFESEERAIQFEKIDRIRKMAQKLHVVIED